MIRSRIGPIMLVALIALVAVSAACSPKGTGNDQMDAAVDPVDAAPDTGTPDARILPDAYIPRCGNGILDTGEVCDDGNNDTGDGCNATCSLVDDDDFVANTRFVGDQRAPAVAASAAGAAIVWGDEAAADASQLGIRTRLFAADGVVMTPAAIGNSHGFNAATTVRYDQREAAVAMASDGRFVVVWRDESDVLGGGSDIRAQFFDADATRRSNPLTGSADFPVHASVVGTQVSPAVAISESGSIFIVWADQGGTPGDGAGWAIHGRIFDWAGQPQTNSETASSDEFLVNVSTAGDQTQPTVAAGAGFWVVAYTDSVNHDGNASGIVATQLTGDGAHISADWLVNTTTVGVQEHPSIAMQGTVGFVVVWTDDSRTDDPIFRGIRGRIFDAAGTPRNNGLTLDSNDFPINSVTNGSQQRPRVAADPVGNGFVVVWQDGSSEDGSFAGIAGRVFTSVAGLAGHDLSPNADDFEVNTTILGPQLAPAVAAADSFIVVAWEDESGLLPDDDGSSIRYRFLPHLFP